MLLRSERLSEGLLPARKTHSHSQPLLLASLSMLSWCMEVRSTHRGKAAASSELVLCEQGHLSKAQSLMEPFCQCSLWPYCLELLWTSRAVERLSLVLATWVQVPALARDHGVPSAHCLQGQCRQWRLQDITTPLMITES